MRKYVCDIYVDYTISRTILPNLLSYYVFCKLPYELVSEADIYIYGNKNNLVLTLVSRYSVKDYIDKIRGFMILDEYIICNGDVEIIYNKCIEAIPFESLFILVYTSSSFFIYIYYQVYPRIKMGYEG